MAAVAARTRTPPRPQAAQVPVAMVAMTFAGLMVESEPPKAVSMPAAMTNIHLTPPFYDDSKAFQKIAPKAVKMPMLIPRRPIFTGSGSQMREMASSQKLRREKEVHPRHESYCEAESGNWLAEKEFLRDHWMACEPSLPDRSDGDEGEADEVGTENVGGCPSGNNLRLGGRRGCGWCQWVLS